MSLYGAETDEMTTGNYFWHVSKSVDPSVYLLELNISHAKRNCIQMMHT